MTTLIRTSLVALTLSAAVLAATPSMAGVWQNGWSNGWMNGWNNGWANGWTTNGWTSNGWSNGRQSEAEGHALRVIGIELPR